MRAALSEAGPAVRRYLYGMCGRWHEAEDLAQETLLKAWRKRDGFDGRADVKTWVFRIARNHWLDRLRRRRVRPLEQSMIAELHTASVASGPLQSAARGELAAAIEQAMGKLPDEQREALALRESEGLTFVQIAVLTNVPAATVKSRVRYALLKLADELKAYKAELES
jgi:RNA polymerase sigma-70 factor (ECF subfamily)